jgi:RNA polymerase-binding transcription factor DksA
MRREDAGDRGPRWRAILEERWRARVGEVTELSLEYHGAADTPRGIDDKRARRLLRRTTDARRRLADTEDALGRLAAGHFGVCEECGALIPVALLAVAPESRYCPDCVAGALESGARPPAPTWAQEHGRVRVGRLA